MDAAKLTLLASATQGSKYHLLEVWTLPTNRLYMVILYSTAGCLVIQRITLNGRATRDFKKHGRCIAVACSFLRPLKSCGLQAIGGRQVRVIITQSDHYHHWSKWFKWSSTPLALGVDDILGETGCAARSYAIPSDFIFTAVAHSITADQDVWCSSPWFYGDQESSVFEGDT